MKELITIGYGNRTLNEFLEILKKHEVKYLIDVRSKPYSRFKYEFNKKALSAFLKDNNIAYTFMGDELGGKPKDPSLYVDDQLDYNKVTESLSYREGVSKLLNGISKEEKIAIMCAELDPRNCHRYSLVGNSLHDLGIKVLHVEKNGSIISHQELRGLF